MFVDCLRVALRLERAVGFSGVERVVGQLIWNGGVSGSSTGSEGVSDLQYSSLSELREIRSSFFSSSFKLPDSLTNCRSTETQVDPSSALKRTKHHQSDQKVTFQGFQVLVSYIHTSKFFTTYTDRIPFSDRIRSTTRLPNLPVLLSSLVYLTSVERVRGVFLCSLERQDSPLLQGLKVGEDPLSKDPNFQTTSTTSKRNLGRGTDSHSIPV